MPLPTTAAGRRLDITLPNTDWPELQERVDEHQRLVRERKVTGTRIDVLIQEREKAAHADREALAQAIRDGKKEPSTSAVEKVEKEIAACNRRLEALDVALGHAEDDLIGCLDQHRDDWTDEARQVLDKARAAYAEHVEALATIRKNVSERFSLVYWLHNFPDNDHTYRVRPSHVPGLTAPHGGPYTFEEVLNALRTDANPPKAEPDNAPATPEKADVRQKA